MNGTYLSLLSAVGPVFVMIAAGWGMRRVGWLTEEADASLLRVVVNLLFPCLILDTILGNRALENAGNLLLAPAVGFGTIVFGYALSYFTAPLFGVRSPRARRTFAFTTGMYNYGYIALPLVQKLFDQPASDARTSGVLFIHNLGVEVALWTVGIVLISGGGKGTGESDSRQRDVEPDSFRARFKHLLNAPVVTIVLAVGLHFTGARVWLPAFVLNAVHGLGTAGLPLALVLTGATYADEMRGVTLRNSAGDSLGALVLRLGVLPICFLALARWLPCPIELRRIIVVQAAMPCAMVPVILSKHYGGDPALSLRIVLVTTALGLLTIPLWIQVGLRWIGG